MRTVPRLVFLFTGVVSFAVFASATPVPPDAPPDGPFEKVGEVDGGVLNESDPFDARGSAFVTVDKEGARVWDTRTLKPLTQPLAHDHVWYARLVNGGKTLFTAGPREVRFWDVATSELRFSVKAAKETLRHADASPDGAWFTAIDRAGGRTVAVWRTGDARPSMLLPHNGNVWGAEFDPAGKHIVTYDSYQIGVLLHVWSAETGRELFTPVKCSGSFSQHGLVRFDPDGKRLLIGEQSGFIVVDAATGKRLVGVEFDSLFSPGNLRFSGHGKKVSVPMLDCNDYKSVRVFDAASGKLEREFGKDVYDCLIGPGGRWAWCSTLGTPVAYEVWDLTTGALVQKIESSSELLAMSPDGSTVLGGAGEQHPARTTTVWRLKKGEPAK